MTEEIGTRRGELVTSDESSVLAEPFLDAVVMEDGKGYGCLADPSGSYKSNGRQGFCEVDDLFDKLVASKTGPWCWGR